MAEHHLTVTRTARYQQLGELSAATKHVWLVGHGYGQLAAYFIRHFAFLLEDSPPTVVIAPEGLSRFYLNGTSGRVGASWMTRDDRLHEIDDHVDYLNQLTALALAQCSPAVQLTVLGFSQGTATVSRWLARAGGRWPLRQLVLWGGTFPEDIAADAARQLLQAQPVTLVCGHHDQYLSDVRLREQVQLLRHFGCEPTVRQFDGGHELRADILRQL